MLRAGLDIMSVLWGCGLTFNETGLDGLVN